MNNQTETRAHRWMENQNHGGVDAAPVDTASSSFTERFILIWLLGIVVLLPINIINFPMNTTLVDLWVFLAMPIVWMLIVRGKHPISVSYFIAMWIIVIASLASTVSATKPSNSLVVLLKEIYVYVWFITLVIVLARLSTKDHHRIMNVWTWVVLSHGLLIIAQFLSPDLWQSITSFAGRSASYDYYRPSGLFLCDTAGCANRAAYFQLLGFIPLMLARYTKRKTLPLGLVTLLSILATGSMGALLAFMFGLGSAIIAIAIFKKQMFLVIHYFLRLLVAVSVFGVIFLAVVSQNQRYQDHFKSIVVGRAGRSSEGRFALWTRGLEVVVERHIGLWGIGPDNFRVVDWQGKQLHNDLLAFLVERGLLGVSGLIAIAFIAVTKALNLLLANFKTSEHAELVEVIFLAAILATLFESLTHQIFHDRQLWFVLAVLEATVYKKMLIVRGEVATSKLSGSYPRQQGLALQNEGVDG